MKPFRSPAALVALALLSACADQQPMATVPTQPEPPASSITLQCVAQVRERTLSCTRGGTAPGGDAIILGGQNTYVKLTSSNVAYDTSTTTLSADVTIQNLLQQAMGTADGVAPDAEGIRVFFHLGPVVTAGSGTVTVKNADGTGDFTGTSQPFFRYTGILAPGATSAAKTWQFNVPVSATAFAFQVLLDLRVQPSLVVSEIQAHPTTASEGAGEWFEIYNAGYGSVDLNGWTIASGGDAGHTITTTLRIPTHGYLVVGGSADTTANGGVPVSYAWSGVSLGNDATDWLVLRTPSGVTVDSVSWGARAGDTPSPPTAGVARTLVAVDSSHHYLSGANASYRNSVEVYGSAGQRGNPGTGALLPVHGVSVGVGLGHSCVLDNAGQAWCVGGPGSAIGKGSYGSTPTLAAVAQPAGTSFTQLSLAYQSSCALSSVGKVWCWGISAYPFYNSDPWPLPAPNQSETYQAVVDFGSGACALDLAGTGYCWGGAWNAASVDFAPPKTDLAYYGGLMCVVSSGRVYCQGNGLVGDSTAQTSFKTWSEARLPAGMTFTNVETTAVSTCALSSTGQLYCWGHNTHGQLGTGAPASYASINYPVPVAQPAGVTFTTFRMGTSAGGVEATVCAVSSAGQVYCWGDNSNGQIGDGSTTMRLSPTPVFQRGLLFSDVAVNANHACALEQGSGQPFCWGDNGSYQLADGTTTDRLIPAAAGR